MNRNKTATQSRFAVVPAADIPRSKQPIRQTRKMAFDASDLIPIMCEEVMPGDVWHHTESIAARLATPIAPIIDDMDLETFYFFVPNRITNDNWEDFITGVDTTLQTPLFTPSEEGTTQIVVGDLLDHFGLPPTLFTESVYFNVLPILAYFKIYNDWFRDQNLQNEWEWNPAWVFGYSTSITQEVSGLDVPWNQHPLRINKRPDYFTKSLPWPQKGQPVSIPLASQAPIYTTAATGDAARVGADATLANSRTIFAPSGGNADTIYTAPAGGANSGNLYAKLDAATLVTINALRIGAMTQQLLERDARGGSRYTEQLMAHFKVRSPDFRLQRPEYLGGAKIPVTINPIAQTAAYTAEPGAVESAVGNLGAEMHASSHKNTFTYAATEHGYIIGLAAVRASPTYQQGVRKHWTRLTRLDYPWPEFANIGEQAVSTREIFQTADSTWTNSTWGYQERYGEMRYTPNEITGVLRSTAPQPLDWWHLSEEFGTEPALNADFITDKTKETLARALATAPSEQWSAQIIFDIQHGGSLARLLPAYGVPGIDRF